MNSLKIKFDEIEHPAVLTTEDSKREREAQNWTLGEGSKNILFHAKEKFYQVTTLASKNFKARKFKGEFGTKNIRFANPEEVLEQSGCESGAIPPFGHLNSDLPLYFDEAIFALDYFMFNPALHEKSIRVKGEDMKKIISSLKNPVKIFSLEEDSFEIKEELS